MSSVHTRHYLYMGFICTAHSQRMNTMPGFNAHINNVLRMFLCILCMYIHAYMHVHKYIVLPKWSSKVLRTRRFSLTLAYSTCFSSSVILSKAFSFATTIALSAFLHMYVYMSIISTQALV